MCAEFYYRNSTQIKTSVIRTVAVHNCISQQYSYLHVALQRLILYLVVVYSYVVGGCVLTIS